MSTPDWSPEQYERFRDERSQPFFDLMGLVARKPAMRVVDLGCGTGELTRLLHERLGAWKTLGLDSSAAMLAKSGALASDGLRFERGDIAAFTLEKPFDLVFSNAALQWVPDHPALLARLTELLEPGGQLAVQVPANHDHASHLVAAEIAREAPFVEVLGGYARTKPILDPEEYATLLHALGYRRQHVRLQVYGHLLPTRDHVVEWVKGTLLTDYQKRMPEELYRLFLDRYRERLIPRLGASDPYFFAFKRLLFWAER